LLTRAHKHAVFSPLLRSLPNVTSTFIWSHTDRVFIRGGKTLENEVEAYAVMWGTILKP
jgi:hypothetical protein